MEEMTGKIEVGLLDNKLIRNYRKLRNSKLSYQPRRYTFLVSPLIQPNLFNIEL